MNLLAPHAVQVEPAAELEFQGPGDIAATFWSYRSTFPDLHVTVADLFACGDRAVAELTLRGTYEAYTYGRSARAISWYGCLVMEVEGDKVIRIALYADRLNMRDQLGALPLAPEAPASNPHGFYYRRLEPVVSEGTVTSQAESTPPQQHKAGDTWFEAPLELDVSDDNQGWETAKVLVFDLADAGESVQFFEPSGNGAATYPDRRAGSELTLIATQHHMGGSR